MIHWKIFAANKFSINTLLIKYVYKMSDFSLKIFKFIVVVTTQFVSVYITHFLDLSRFLRVFFRSITYNWVFLFSIKLPTTPIYNLNWLLDGRRYCA